MTARSLGRSVHLATSKTVTFRKIGGFTLVELMVVMSLLTLIVVSLGATLRTFAMAEQRIDQRLERADDFRVSISFMRSVLSRISRRTVPALQDPSARSALFSGSSNSLAWVGIMPARYGVGGKYYFRLAPEQTDKGMALMLRFAPWADPPVFPDWARAESRVLVGAVESALFTYEDASTEDIVWTPDWLIKDKLPQHIRLQIQTLTGPWPMLTFQLGSTVQGSGQDTGGASFGGRPNDD